ncbi:MAG: glucose-1-phosphate adenylyltransferase subunit GlgD [Christensenellales bacterium]|jgi:glucose-1-phosphate adenylyltransferase|nr:glucose-1-phosphate adenylyltransferase subunit GlgD [Clostridiales bacterium]
MVNKKMMAILFASGTDNKLSELTIHRTAASLPFCGRYRLIDFILSSLVNSGVNRVGIITKNNYQSLMDHIRMGRDWDLNRKNSGIAVFPPFVLNTARDMYRGKIEALYTVLDYIEKSPEDYVVISDCNIVANIDFNKVLDEHIAREANVTILCHSNYATTSKRMMVSCNSEGLVTDLNFAEMPTAEKKIVSTNIYVVTKKYLIEEIEKAYSRALFDFEKDILFQSYKDGKIFVHQLEGFTAIIDDIKNYFNENMKILEEPIREQLFDVTRKVYTKVKDSVPTLYGPKSEVVNSLVADGCVIEGRVENSILFRNVHIAKGASVKNCIVMESGQVLEGSRLSYIITDKEVVITEGRELAGFKTYPLVIAKNKTV